MIIAVVLHCSSKGDYHTCCGLNRCIAKISYRKCGPSKSWVGSGGFEPSSKGLTVPCSTWLSYEPTFYELRETTDALLLSPLCSVGLEDVTGTVLPSSIPSFFAVLR